jgi:hypothetical protein
MVGDMGRESDASLIATPDTDQGSDTSFVLTPNKNKKSNALLSRYQKWAGGVMHHLLWREVCAGSINASLFTTPYMGSGSGSHASPVTMSSRTKELYITSNGSINASL